MHRLRTHGLYPVSQDALSRRYTPVERRAHQHMAEQVSARCTLCTPSPSTPRQHARTLTRRWSKPPTTPRAATPSHPHSTRAAAARTPMPTGGNPAMQASTRPRPHPARADNAHTPMHATRDRPTRARECRRSSGGVRPPGTAQPRAQEHGTPMPCSTSRCLSSTTFFIASHQNSETTRFGPKACVVLRHGGMS